RRLGALRLRFALPQRRWARIALFAAGVPAVLGAFILSYLWVADGRLIEAKLRGEETRPIPRVFGRPFEIHPGQPLSTTELIQQLNDVGYAERPKPEQAGEFALAGTSVLLVPRPVGSEKSQLVRVDFARGAVSRLTPVGVKGITVDQITLEAPLLAELAAGEKRRYVPLAGIPKQMVDAVIAIEDRRFFEHPGVDPIRAVGAIVTNLRGDKPYLVGGSTLTQQIVKNTFLTPEKTLRRKVQEQFMALVLESRFTKNQILELYLNDVVLGQRGPFEIHGVGEASRLFFGKDVSNLSLAEAATIAGVIQSPSRLSPFRNPERAIERRNLVLATMVDAGFATKAEADAAAKEPIGVTTRALENEEPYFVDYVSQLVDDKYSNLLRKDADVDVYTTLDLHLQRLAQETVASGLTDVDKQLAWHKRKQAPEAALVAVDPRTGEILAMVGGRAYSVSQYNRAVSSRRQPGSTFKPFVYLTAFERMAADGRADLTPATVMDDEPTTFQYGDTFYTPSNYQNEYDGPITLRQALERSRNVVAVKVAEQAGYDNVANLWNKIGAGTPAKPYPALALGVFEASPLEMATAYTLFTNKGSVRPLTAISRLVESGKAKALPAVATKPIAREDTTFLVTNMMRGVMDEGTGAGARAAGFSYDAAGKSGTTDQLRDAWFIGFTPELLTVVWVGYDDNEVLGLSGSQAALPMWTTFMKKAMAGRPNEAFEIPDGITFADIDYDNGKLATPRCPKVVHEAFLAGTEPTAICDVHSNLFNRLEHVFGWIR
ncbi:MAG TPA: PBP1A family penicillin-binding protein, partial [Vicinamibacterales bacterium]